MLRIRPQLEALNQHLKSEAPPELVELFDQGVGEMLATTAGDASLETGSKAPDFELSDLNGARLSLDGHAQGRHVVLLFFRGGWCPFCQLQLKTMNKALPRVKQAGATLLAITPETPESAQRTLGELGLKFPILHDAGATVARQYGLVFTLNAKLQALQTALGVPLDQINGTDNKELPVPAVFVVDPGGQIVWRHVDRDYRLSRAEPNDILDALKQTKDV